MRHLNTRPCSVGLFIVPDVDVDNLWWRSFKDIFTNNLEKPSQCLHVCCCCCLFVVVIVVVIVDIVVVVVVIVVVVVVFISYFRPKLFGPT